jgi:hypothetical protein
MNHGVNWETCAVPRCRRPCTRREAFCTDAGRSPRCPARRRSAHELKQGELVAFRPSSAAIDFEAQSDTEFVLGSAVSHHLRFRPELPLSAYHRRGPAGSRGADLRDQDELDSSGQALGGTGASTPHLAALYLPARSDRSSQLNSSFPQLGRAPRRTSSSSSGVSALRSVGAQPFGSWNLLEYRLRLRVPAVPGNAGASCSGTPAQPGRFGFARESLISGMRRGRIESEIIFASFSSAARPSRTPRTASSRLRRR